LKKTQHLILKLKKKTAKQATAEREGKISKSKKEFRDGNQSTNNTHRSQHCNKSAINDAIVVFLVGW